MSEQNEHDNYIIIGTILPPPPVKDGSWLGPKPREGIETEMFIEKSRGKPIYIEHLIKNAKYIREQVGVLINVHRAPNRELIGEIEVFPHTEGGKIAIRDVQNGKLKDLSIGIRMTPINGHYDYFKLREVSLVSVGDQPNSNIVIHGYRNQLTVNYEALKKLMPNSNSHLSNITRYNYQPRTILASRMADQTNNAAPPPPQQQQQQQQATQTSTGATNAAATTQNGNAAAAHNNAARQQVNNDDGEEVVMSKQEFQKIREEHKALSDFVKAAKAKEEAKIKTHVEGKLNKIFPFLEKKYPQAMVTVGQGLSSITNTHANPVEFVDALASIIEDAEAADNNNQRLSKLEQEYENNNKRAKTQHHSSVPNALTMNGTSSSSNIADPDDTGPIGALIASMISSRYNNRPIDSMNSGAAINEYPPSNVAAPLPPVNGAPPAQMSRPKVAGKTLEEIREEAKHINFEVTYAT